MGNESGTWIMYGVSREDPECIHTVDEAVEYINKVGFLPLFKNFSGGGHTCAARPPVCCLFQCFCFFKRGLDGVHHGAAECGALQRVDPGDGAAAGAADSVF